MANLTIQRVAESAELNREMCDLYREGSSTEALLSASESFKELPDAFNNLRLAVNEASRAMKDHMATYEDFRRTFGKSLSLGLEGVVKATSVPVKGIEDDVTFIRALTEIGKERNLIARMKACAKVEAEIAARVKEWTSKETKLMMRERGDGSSEAEIKVVAKKLLMIRDTLDGLRQRGETVSTMYYEAKRAAEAEIAKINSVFAPMFTSKRAAV